MAVIEYKNYFSRSKEIRFDKFDAGFGRFDAVKTTEFSTVSWIVDQEERTKVFNWKLAHLTVVSGGHHSQNITEI